MTLPAEQLIRDTGLIVTVSAAASFGQHAASMRQPPTAQSRMCPSLLIVSALSTAAVNRPIAIAKMMTTGVKSGITVEEESPLTNKTVTSTSIHLIVGRETTTLKQLKSSSDITTTRTAIHQIKSRRVADLIVAGSTEKNLSRRRAAREAASALLQTGCAAGPVIPTASATGLARFRQGNLIHDPEMRVRESTSQATVLIARLALRTDTGLMRNPKRKISGMCAEG